MADPTLPENAQPDSSPVPAPSTLTVVETVYHQPAGGFPDTLLGDASRYHRELASDEQAYERHRVLKTAWEPLDCGWVEKCGMLLIRNDEGQFHTIPTPEQRAEVMRRVIQVAFGDEDPSPCSKTAVILVPPGETCRFYPADAKLIRLRCIEGNARYTICLVPE